MSKGGHDNRNELKKRPSYSKPQTLSQMWENAKQ
jgi:hypothetical protein